MRTITKLVTVGTSVAALGGLGLAGTASATTPAPHPKPVKPVVRHVEPRHHDLLALCHRTHHRYPQFVIRVHDRHQLRAIEHRFDLDCKVLRVL